jgi:hypothetical protein
MTLFEHGETVISIWQLVVGQCKMQGMHAADYSLTFVATESGCYTQFAVTTLAAGKSSGIDRTVHSSPERQARGANPRLDRFGFEHGLVEFVLDATRRGHDPTGHARTTVATNGAPVRSSHA